MDCICDMTCTIRKGNKSIYVEKGQIFDFDECPKNFFSVLGEVSIDFETASIDHLLKSKNWKIKDALEYLKKEFKYEPSGILTRKEVARKIVDMRMRRVTLPNEV